MGCRDASSESLPRAKNSDGPASRAVLGVKTETCSRAACQGAITEATAGVGGGGALTTSPTLESSAISSASGPA